MRFTVATSAPEPRGKQTVSGIKTTSAPPAVPPPNATGAGPLSSREDNGYCSIADRPDYSQTPMGTLVFRKRGGTLRALWGD